MKAAITFLILIAITIALISTARSQLDVQCEGGGPYIKNSLIDVIGNVTFNGAGSGANLTINITDPPSNKTLRATRNSTSDSDGKFFQDFSEVLDAGNYTINISAERQGTVRYCNATVEVKLQDIAVSCSNKTVTVEGYALYASTAAFVTSGTATSTIVEKSASNSVSLNSTGGFAIPIVACLDKGKRYTVLTIVEDSTKKRSTIQEFFISQ